MDYKSCKIHAVNLYHKCQGVILFFLLVFYCLKNIILFPLGFRLWNYILSTTPEHFITDKNVFVLLQCPQVLLVGVFLIAAFCFITIWELCGIMLCFHSYYQNQPVKLLSLFRLSLMHMRQLSSPKNWLFFVYVLLIMPFIDLYSASGMLSSFSIPEYISQFIIASPVLFLLLIALVILLTILCIRWFYVIQGVLLGEKSFAESCRDSAFLMKNRTLRQLGDLFIYAIYQFITICFLPLVISVVLMIIELGLFHDFAAYQISARIVFLRVFPETFKAALSILLRMSVSSYLVVNYFEAAKEKQLSIDTELPDYVLKKGPALKFRWLKPLLLLGTISLSLILYPLCNVLFRENPELLPEIMPTIQIAAHKGYCSEAPENTMPAFQKALDCGSADFIELDIRESRDGIPIVIHNSSMKDATGINETVYSRNYEYIRSLNAHYEFLAEDYPDAYIPTLEEVLQEFGGKINLLIEIKMSPNTPELPRKIVELIHKYDLNDSCMIHSGSYASLEMVKALDSSIPCGYIIAFGTGSYYNLPCADFFSVEHSFVNTSMLNTIHNLNKKVFAWTVNEEASIQKLATTDVDVIITDYPNLIYDNLHSMDNLIESVVIEMLPDSLLELDTSKIEADKESY